MKTHLNRLELLLDEAKNDLDADPELFRTRKIFKMSAFIGTYFQLMKELGVHVSEDIETAVEEPADWLKLAQIKSDWDAFLLGRVEKKASETTNLPATFELNEPFGDEFVQDQSLFGRVTSETEQEKEIAEQLSLQDLQQVSGGKKYMLMILLRHFAWLPWRDHVREVQAQLPEYLRLDTQVVVVSFGQAVGAVKWLNEMSLLDSVIMIIDETRSLYNRFGVTSSFYKVWSTESLIYYAEQKLAGRQLPQAYEDVEDDPHQMGGDFIVESTDGGDGKLFKLVFSHPSQSPPDRPSSKSMISFLEKKHTQ